MNNIRTALSIGLLAMCGAASAQTSGPLVAAPAEMAVSEPLTVIAARGQANAFLAREPRVNRDHKMRKNVDPRSELVRAKALIAPSLAVPANTPYYQTANYQPLNAVMGVNFEALGVGTPGFAISGAPPDTTMAVSPNYVVQWVNTQIGIYNKSGTSLLPAPGFINGNQLWQGLPLGSLCRAVNRGDPIVQYDKHANRWIFSQFAFNSTFSENAQCIAVSVTDNPLGAYYLYQYNFGNLLPDYGKLGVWPDAYYITYNMFNVGANTFNGGRSCAYDRTAMQAGLPATQICFNSLAFFSYLPSDLDGFKLPPAGSPNYQISWDWYNTRPPYTIQLTKFKPDFVTPANSTFNDGSGGGTFSFVAFTLDAASVAACNDAGTGAGFQCVQQLGTAQTLDTLGDRQMYRLSYRSYGSFDALLITQAIDDSTGVNAHLRWFEIRNPGAPTPQVYQNSTYRPSTHARWMSSGAQDKVGNIAIGYSVSSSAMNPSIRVAGRRKTDPKNLLRTEVSIKEGTGSQTGGLERWGDYSTMQVDPTDDCTFWYTQQYIAANGTFNWNTRVASFRFPNCN
jgi:hypothetical protein